MKVPWFVVASLTIAQATLIFAGSVWFHALQFNEGRVEACLDCAGEGFIELFFFVLASSLTTLSLAWVVNQIRTERKATA